MPKIWKGTRKRKKQRSDSDRSYSGTGSGNDSIFNDEFLRPQLQTIREETNNNNNLDEDVFKLFDEEFGSSTNKEEKKGEEKSNTKSTTNESLGPEQQQQQERQDKEREEEREDDDDEPEIEESDEVEFLRPVLIDDFNEKCRVKDGEKLDGGMRNNKDSGGGTWECGPAAYWYSVCDLESLIIDEKRRIAEKENLKNKVYRHLIF